MKPFYFLSVLLAAGVAVAADYAPELPTMTSRGEPTIVRVSQNTETVPRFAKLELTIALAASYDNPFDPDQVDLTAEFITPSGKKIAVPGFFCQPYRNRNEGDDAKRPSLEAAGEPCWKIRFAPTETGKHSYVVRLRNRFGGARNDVKSMPGGFAAVASDTAGFIHVSKTNPRYFEFDNGRPFFAVGQNLQNDWPSYRHSRLLADGRANCARVWTFCHWTWLEWTFKSGFKWVGPGDWLRSYAGAGRYNQRIAWITDDCLDRWTRDGLFVMLCLGNATGGGELSREKTASYDSWGGHPYNVANGGFLDEPRQFWTDARARQLYKQRLRYIIARWGYSPNIWAFEFWNELGGAGPEIVAWHQEMARYVREADPNGHLITTSTWEGNADKFAAIWDLKEMDFTQGHHYGPLPPMTVRITEHLRRWAKPYINGEGGGPSAQGWDGESAGKPSVVDPDDVEFHNSLWAPAMSGSAGTTLPWWWRDRVEPHNLFFHYHAVADFARDVPWTSNRLRPVQIKAVTLTGSGPRKKFSPVLVAPFGADWGSKPTQSRFCIEADGTVPNLARLPAELFGKARGRSEWRNPLTFETHFPEPGRFIVHVSKIAHGVLEISLDGQLVVTGKSAEKEIPVEVPAGRHEITLDNAGNDLVRFGYILLTNYRDAARYPDLDILGQQTDDFAALWIHNRLRQWPYEAAGFEAGPVGPAVATIAGLKEGRYHIEWWDTCKGVVTRTGTLEARNKTLVLPIPTVDRDIACKIAMAKE